MAKKTAPAPEAIELTPEEVKAVIAMRAQLGPPAAAQTVSSHQDLANALITAIEATRPPAKKTPFNRPRNGPWEPKDGTKKGKLKRKMFHHGQELGESTLSPREIELLNKVKSGSFCGGFIKVIKRKDRSLDIDYPIKTASQRLKLVNAFGIRTFAELLERLIDEADNRLKYKTADEDDD
jgi:hypothetical protein